MRGSVPQVIGWGAVLALIMVALVGTVLDAGPAWSAKLGSGVRGTFTARTCERGQYGCYWTGSFVSDNGTDRRTGVGVTPGSAITAPGQKIAAVDTGDWADIYPVGGGHGWAVTAGSGLVSLAALAWWVLAGPVAAARRRRTGRGSWANA